MLSNATITERSLRENTVKALFVSRNSPVRERGQDAGGSFPGFHNRAAELNSTGKTEFDGKDVPSVKILLEPLGNVDRSFPLLSSF